MMRTDPLVMLENIQVLMHETARGQYPFQSAFDTLKGATLCVQGDDEPLIDYEARVKLQRDLLMRQLGNNFLEDFVMNQSKYQLACSDFTKSKIKAEAFNRFMAFIFLQGACKDKYGSIQRGLARDYAVGKNFYPKTMDTVRELLSQHQWDSNNSRGRRRNQNHDDDGMSAASFAQHGQTRQIVCFKCGTVGHGLNQCHKQLPNETDWWLRKMALRYCKTLQPRNDNTSDDASSHASSHNQVNIDSPSRESRRSQRSRRSSTSFMM